MVRFARLRHFHKNLSKYFLAAIFSIFVTFILRFYFFTTTPAPPIPAAPSRSFSFHANGTGFKGIEITTDPSRLALYLNYFDQYPCPYYSDRADLIAPEINRVAQLLRSFGSKIIFHTKTITPTTTSTTTPIPDITDNHLNETSPLLEDKCLFSDFDKSPVLSNGSIHRAIRFSTKDDYFADTHVNALKIVIDLNIEYLVVGGMKCNQWLPAFFEQLKEIGIEPIYLYDLSDVAFFRAAQKEKIDTHVQALKKFWSWIVGKGFKIVNHFFLIDRETLLRPVGGEIKWDGNNEAYYFKDYFYPDFS